MALASVFVLGCDDEGGTSGEDTTAADTSTTTGDTSTTATTSADTSTTTDDTSTTTGDTSTTTTGDTSTTTGDTTTGDTTDLEIDVGCCTDAECAATDQECDESTCMCVDLTRCVIEGAACDPTGDHPIGMRCRDDGTGSFVCVAACTSPDDCAAGEVCVPGDDPNDLTATCVASECDGFLDTTSCASGEKCFWLTDQDAGVCIPAGPGALDDPCEMQIDCGAGLFCDIPGACAAAECIPTDVANQGCASGEVCAAARDDAIDVGSCLADTCVVADSATDCPGGEFCRVYGRDAATGELVGFCGTDTPSASIGDPCTDDTDCAGLDQCLVGFCQRVCDATDPNACSTYCDPVVIGPPENRYPISLGLCLDVRCDPENQTGCAAGEACRFLERDLNGDPVGVCGVAGGDTPGTACTMETTCDTSICAFEQCTTTCDPQATSGNLLCSGNCLDSGDLEAFIGICDPDGCTDPFGGTGCAADESCIPIVIEDQGHCEPIDATASTGDACTTIGFGECPASHICLGDGTTNNCLPFCDLQAGVGDPGECSGTQSCNELQDINGNPVGFGVCDVAGSGCTFGGNDCAAGETCTWIGFANPHNLAHETTACLQVAPSDCAGAQAGFLCGELDACLVVPEIVGDDTLTCIEICRASQGAMLTIGHPDCSDPAAICDPAFGNDDFGLCHSAL